MQLKLTAIASRALLQFVP